MDEGILLATKTLVNSIDKFPPLLFAVFKMADEFKVCRVERRRHFITFVSNKKMLICLQVHACLPVFIVNAYFLI